MADQPGDFDLRKEDVDSIVKNFALEQFTGRQVCSIIKTSSESNVYFEETDDVWLAIQREKNLKKWKRSWKLQLIEEENPNWDDLYNDLF